MKLRSHFQITPLCSLNPYLKITHAFITRSNVWNKRTLTNVFFMIFGDSFYGARYFQERARCSLIFIVSPTSRALPNHLKFPGRIATVGEQDSIGLQIEPVSSSFPWAGRSWREKWLATLRIRELRSFARLDELPQPLAILGTYLKAASNLKPLFRSIWRYRLAPAAPSGCRIDWLHFGVDRVWEQTGLVYILQL